MQWLTFNKRTTCEEFTLKSGHYKFWDVMHHFKTRLKFSSQCNYLANPQIWVDVERGWTIKRMEEGFRIRMEKGLFRRDMLICWLNVWKTQVFPTFSESHFVMVGPFSVPSLGFLYSAFPFDNLPIHFLFNLVTWTVPSLPVFLSVPGPTMLFSSFTIIIFHIFSLILHPTRLLPAF